MTYREILEQNGNDFREYMEKNHLQIPYALAESEGNHQVLSELLIASTNSITELTALLAIAKLEVRYHASTGEKQKYQEFVDKRDIIKDYINACEYVNKTVSRLITVRQMELSELNAIDYRKER